MTMRNIPPEQIRGYEIRVQSVVPVPADIPPARSPGCRCTVVHPARVQDFRSLVMIRVVARHDSACRGVVLRVMPPRSPDDQLHRHRRRVRSPSRGASKVDVIVGPERTRHIVTRLSSGMETRKGWAAWSSVPGSAARERESAVTLEYTWMKRLYICIRGGALEEYPLGPGLWNGLGFHIRFCADSTDHHSLFKVRLLCAAFPSHGILGWTLDEHQNHQIRYSGHRCVLQPR